MGLFDMFFGKKEPEETSEVVDEFKNEPPSLVKDLKIVIRKKHKIEALKLIRTVTGIGLKEAKDFYESFLESDLSIESVRGKFPLIAEKFTGSTGEGEEYLKDPAYYLREIEILIREGKKIQAIKRAREFTGAGLKNAKDFVDYFEETAFSIERLKNKFAFLLEGLPMSSEEESEYAREVSLVWTGLPSGEQELLTYGVRAEIEDTIKKGRKIEAIKIFREKTGRGLKEAKDFIEDLERDIC